MSDRYDEAIAYLTENPTAIPDAWSFPYSKGGCLFLPCGCLTCGCLTQIRSDTDQYKAATAALTREIAADERIPMSKYDIKLEHLPVFAEWQRRLDRELNRTA